MPGKDHAGQRRKLAIRMIEGGAAAGMTILLAFLIHCMVHADEAKDIAGFAVFAAVVAAFIWLCLRNFFPAKKRRALVVDKGIDSNEGRMGTEYIAWIDVRIKNKLKRWYTDDDDTYRDIQRGEEYTFYLKRRTVVKAKIL